MQLSVSALGVGVCNTDPMEQLAIGMSCLEQDVFRGEKRSCSLDPMSLVELFLGFHLKSCFLRDRTVLGEGLGSQSRAAC